VKKYLGLVLTLAAVLAALAAPWLTPHDPLRADFAAGLKPPGTPGHPLGTDQLGRDLLTRVLHGSPCSSAAAPSSSPRWWAGCWGWWRASSSGGRPP
jgi:ABC-type dipeptide/oligopeptide/nickel transport system permease subunit